MKHSVLFCVPNHLLHRTLHYIVEGLDPLRFEQDKGCLYATEKQTTPHHEHKRLNYAYANYAVFETL